MKKIILIMLCAMLMFAFPVVAFAMEGETVTDAIPTDDTVEIGKTITESIAKWIQTNYKDISVITTLLLTIFYEVRKHGKLNGSIGTLNNNAITVAKDSATAISTALSMVEEISATVANYKEEIALVLGEIRKNAEEKKALEDTLREVENYLKNAKLSNVEFANELAELLCLANIPNSKKEELYARHRAAVANISDAEAEITEVTLDVGKEE